MSILTQEEVNDIIRMRKNGMSVSKIKEVTGRSDYTIRKYTTAEKKKGRPVFVNYAPWKAHCETCLYAFRPAMKSHSTHIAKGCELEIEDRKNCRLWRDTKHMVKIPEWVDVKDDLPQMMADGISITVRVRMISGDTDDAYCDEDGKWFFESGEPVPEKYPVIRWRSL